MNKFLIKYIIASQKKLQYCDKVYKQHVLFFKKEKDGDNGWHLCYKELSYLDNSKNTKIYLDYNLSQIAAFLIEEDYKDIILQLNKLNCIIEALKVKRSRFMG